MRNREFIQHRDRMAFSLKGRGRYNGPRPQFCTWRKTPMPTNRVYRIAVIPGDGIGKEVVPEGVRVLEAAAKKFGFELRNDDIDFASCDYYERHGRMMPEDWKDKIGKHDASYFGAVGWA